MDKWEWQEEQDRRETETFRRIHRLVKQGYRIDWTVTDVEDAFWLEHPGGGPKLILYPNGMVVATNQSADLRPNAKDERDRVFNEDAGDNRDFDRWLSKVRLPTWKERTASDREKYVWQPGCLILFFLISIGFGKLVETVWKAVFR